MRIWNDRKKCPNVYEIEVYIINIKIKKGSLMLNKIKKGSLMLNEGENSIMFGDKKINV